MNTEQSKIETAAATETAPVGTMAKLKYYESRCNDMRLALLKIQDITKEFNLEPKDYSKTFTVDKNLIKGVAKAVIKEEEEQQRLFMPINYGSPIPPKSTGYHKAPPRPPVELNPCIMCGEQPLKQVFKRTYADGEEVRVIRIFCPLHRGVTRLYDVQASEAERLSVTRKAELDWNEKNPKGVVEQ